MKLFLFSVLPFVLHFFPVFSGMGKDCYILEYTSSGFGGTLGFTSQTCWTIVVPEDMYVRLDIEDLSLTNAVNCSIVYMKITVTERNETYIYCAGDSSYQKPITASSNVTITVSHYSDDIYKNVSKFSAKYHTEDLICAQKNHFRCSRHTCIHDSKVCDGVEDCDNGSDEMECDMNRDRSCLIKKDQFGVISYSLSATAVKCWTIEVPENKYVRLEIKQLSLKTSNCYTYLKIEVMETNETFIYCPKDSCYQKPIIALSDVNIKFSHLFSSFTKSPSSFSLDYHTEDLICAQKNHFRCSNRTCIHSSKVCDGVKDCENGSDEIGCEKGVLAVKGVNESRESTGAWLLKNRKSVGWGRKTHRAVTALFLAQVASFRGENLEEELMVKQLELQTSLALLRNSTAPLSVSELSMFVNALSVTCHNPRRFYGHDLLSILGERAAAGKSPSPGAYLTLCNSNWTLTQSDIHSLLHLLQKHSSYPFALDVQAVAVMALTCVKNLQTKEFTRIQNATDIYNATVEKFITGQLSDGSFGNVYTTALVTQALMASEQESNTKWNVTSTVQYLINQLNSSSVDFLSAYLVLPIFSGRSLVDMAAINCANISRKQDKENEISDVTNKLGGKIRVQYSLYVGDQKEVIHSIYLRMPKKSSAYEIMRLAEIADPKYKFRHMDVSGHMYVYDIAGVINDPEAEKFWLMYSENSNRTVEHHTESPDKFIVDDEEHLIMWYKTVHVWNKR